MNYYRLIKEDRDIINLIFDYIKINYFSDMEIELISKDFDNFRLKSVHQIIVNDVSEDHFENVRIMEINFQESSDYCISPFIFYGISNYNRDKFIKDIKAIFVYNNRIKIIDSL